MNAITVQKKENKTSHSRTEKKAPSFFGPSTLQKKLSIGASNDAYEVEADRVADKVVGMSDLQVQKQSLNPLVQRKCSACEDEQVQKKSLADGITPLIQKKEANSADGGIASNAITSKINSSRGSGRAMDNNTKSFMENRFGADFSNVRLHTGTNAIQLSQQLNAQAFTVGNDIYFNKGKYNTTSTSGKHLLAHELTHTLQQEGNNSNGIQRNVANNSNCPANTHNSTADPITTLTTIDLLAQNMALSASHLLFLESATFSTPEFGRSSIFDAYNTWFGTPIQTSTGRWRSRFRTATFASENEAIEHEMTTLSNRFGRIHTWLKRDHRYICPGTRSYTIPGCSPGPCGSMAAQTCPTGSRTIGICPEFWNEPSPTDRSQAAVLIHEAIHPLFHFRHHSTANVRGRGRNPGCYQGFILDVFDTGLTPGDCTRI